jgi:hypothetical protein
LWASDLGGGTIDQVCTGRFTSSQVDVESSIVEAISPGGAFPLISDGGIDVLHVNHHGSESSTNKNWMNYAQPAVALISTGAGQSGGWEFPRIDVVEKVLQSAASCISAPPALVLQTEEGSISGPQTSFAGYSVGNIKVATDGMKDFTVSADGQVNQGPSEVAAAGLPRTFALDDVTPVSSTDVTGFKLRQQNSTYNYTFPAGTRVPHGGYLIVARNASRADFERFYKVTLGPSVVFQNAGGALPVLNGDENFTLYSSGGTALDGRTINMTAGGGSALSRKSPCQAANLSTSWNVSSSTAATPGSGAGAGCGKGLVINEFVDPPGVGDYVYEFVELYSDR